MSPQHRLEEEKSQVFSNIVGCGVFQPFLVRTGQEAGGAWVSGTLGVSIATGCEALFPIVLAVLFGDVQFITEIV